jgi:hypothetical protein
LPDYLAHELKKEMPVMPVTKLLISGAHNMNTPIALLNDWFNAVETPGGREWIFSTPPVMRLLSFIDVLHEWAVLIASPVR